MEEKKASQGDIISIGITKNGWIQIEFVDYGAHEGDTDYIMLDKEDCHRITELAKLL